MAGHGTKETMEIGGTQRLEALPQPGIMDRGGRQPRVQEGSPPPFVQAPAHLVEAMGPIENRHDPRCNPTATGQHVGRVHGEQGINERRDVPLAQHAHDQREMGDRRHATNRDRQDTPPGEVYA